jgi:menaquinone-dependent protoporphyrinogen IX oxidase
VKAVVVYATRSGNTKKVAEAVASELNCPCLQITSDSSTVRIDEYDTVFIGTGIYKGQPHQDLLNYLQTMRVNGKKRFTLFMTCFGWDKNVADKNVIGTLKVALEANGQRMIDNHFSCFGGGLGFVKRGHPDAEELYLAKKWAREIAEL